MRGYAHVYPRDHINTDEIIPARYLNTDDREELARHALEDLDPGFVGKVKWGDFIVAGENFGCGSSREHAVWALQGAGVGAVLAESFARIFFRNAINTGFPAIECKGISRKVEDGDELEVDLEAGVVRNLTKGEEYKFSPFPDFALEIMRAGGLLEYLRGREG
ncbi:MAG: 3-isopropylmalate dehydratase small subunit [Candidatus Latescibacterota bacterium]|nr:MAG: 3-isopropylmalate dehydratase small subunit [Candidatus Latescibacterota bacterium]RKY65605.1 MAG: 3-isopropylmalate dehydratase small subunit [Candidatus Latescibacterota bacterium]RKY73737.1 MAG: 3-isopropylmalate dehydratase small subunit [Candidatus Latescibacterota bacterium]